MHKRAGLAAAAFLVAACSESTGPQRVGLRPPAFAAGEGTGVVLDQFAGVMGETGIEIGQGFNPTNPHRGDAIVATFFWRGSTNTITKVFDHLSDGDNGAATVVGNTYTLVEYVTAGGYSMATYVATNVQNFPDPNPDDATVLNVDAVFSSPVTDAGCLLSAWSGVNAVAAQAVGAHRSAWGSGSGTLAAGPGSIATGPGALAYAVTLGDGLVGRDPPAGFTRFADGADTLIVTEGDYALQGATGSVDPQWTWYFAESPPRTWLATLLALNPPLHLAFTVQPSTTLPLLTIQPAVQVTVLDAAGNPITSFNGSVTIAIGHNGGLLLPGKLSGTTTVTAVNGVATFSDLSIDQLGNGYTLVVSAAGVTGAESRTFNIGAF
ncbi:MAG: hypothetical protein DMD58_13100 [Gemmatimonadetes bacterium]|nr:MAG: hypothetical protein DMD58_13100 [Gemmatimonadota bacterium]